MTKPVSILALMLSLTLAACDATPAPQNLAQQQKLQDQVQAALADFHAADPSINDLLTSAHAYAVFPRVITGAVGLGGAHGDGEVYQGGPNGGALIGYADVTQANIGAQLGGQKFSEIIFFQNQSSLVDFKSGEFEFDARATAIAASKGAAATANYRRGVIVMTLPQGGLMVQAALGTQKFRFEPAVR